MKPSDYKVNPVLSSCMTLFNYALLFCHGSRGKELDAGYRDKILVGFNEMERTAYQKHLDPETIKDMKYSMAVYIDEVILNSKWNHREEWMTEPLQLRYFGEHLGGEGFYNRLTQLRQLGQRSTDILELYYVCLQLGFEGIYRLHGFEQLMALQTDLRSQIESYRGNTNISLSPHAKPTQGILQRVRRQVPSWVVGTFTVAVVLSTYVTYSYIIDKVAASTVKTIASNNQHMIRVLKQH